MALGAGYLSMHQNSKHMARPKLVYVFFRQIHMIDDSDDLSDGEFKFFFFLNDELVLGTKTKIKIPGTNKTVEVTPTHISKVMGSGQKRNIDYFGCVKNVNSVKVSVSGIDDDDDIDFLPSFNPSGSGTPDKPLGTGENSWAEWATASITANAPDPPANGSHTSSFVIDVNGHKKGVDVRFKVSGDIVITRG